MTPTDPASCPRQVRAVKEVGVGGVPEGESGPASRLPYVDAADRDRLVARIEALEGGHGRVLLGITAWPGAGKSTLPADLAETLRTHGLPVAWVPMDGFHLADVELDRLGRRERKCAIDTFTGDSYQAFLRPVAGERGHTVYAPAFDRTIEQPVAGAIAVEPATRVVLTEGNFLLDESE